MEKIIVGYIEGYEVLYMPEKDLVFCKNTVLPFKLAKGFYYSSIDRIEVPEKNLTVCLYDDSIELGCLTTSKENYKSIIRTILKIKDARNCLRSSACTSS